MLSCPEANEAGGFTNRVCFVCCCFFMVKTKVFKSLKSTFVTLSRPVESCYFDFHLLLKSSVSRHDGMGLDCFIFRCQLWFAPPLLPALSKPKWLDTPVHNHLLLLCVFSHSVPFLPFQFVIVSTRKGFSSSSCVIFFVILHSCC